MPSPFRSSLGRPKGDCPHTGLQGSGSVKPDFGAKFPAKGPVGPFSPLWRASLHKPKRKKDLGQVGKMYFTIYIMQGTFLAVRRSERVGEWSNPRSFFPRSRRGVPLSDLHFSPVAAVRGEIPFLPSKRPSPGSTHFRRGLTPFLSKFPINLFRPSVDFLIPRYDLYRF